MHTREFVIIIILLLISTFMVCCLYAFLIDNDGVEASLFSLSQTWSPPRIGSESSVLF